MKKEIYKHCMKNLANYDAYMINVKTALLDSERRKTPIEVTTFSRRFLTPYKCVDTINPPIILENHILHGGLIYYKKNQFEWITISLDECVSIYEL